MGGISRALSLSQSSLITPLKGAGGTLRKSTKGWMGEFVVIVVGVLVALGVDDFRSTMDDRNLETYYLEQLSGDLASDEAELGRMVAALDSLEVAGHRWSTLLEDPLSRPLLDDISGIDVSWSFVPRLHLKLGHLKVARATYDEILGSGNLRVIRSPVLRRSLAEYYLQAERLAAYEAQWTQPLTESWLAELREKGLLIIDVAQDSTLSDRLRGDPKTLSLIRALGAGRGFLRDGRMQLATEASQLRAAIESDR